MVVMPVRHNLNTSAIRAMATSPGGAAARDLLRRGLKVESRAKLLLSGAAGHPKRVDTGRLRSDVRVAPARFAGRPAVRVGSNLPRARFVHDGTGRYGPRGADIVPRRAKALVFPGRAPYAKRRGKFAGKVVVRRVKGMRPNRFLADALPAARD